MRFITNFIQIKIQHDDLRAMADDYEIKISDSVQQHPELAKAISKLEQSYDDEVFDAEMTDLKQWLEQQGIRVD